MKIKGFTLVELLVSLVLISLIALFGMSSLLNLAQNNEEQALFDELSGAIHYAKLQAMRLDHYVFLTPLDPHMDWSKGVVLKQLNKDSKDLTTLYQWQWHHSQWRLFWKGVSSKNRIIVSSNPMHGISNGTFTMSNTKALKKKIIVLNKIGRLKVMP